MYCLDTNVIVAFLRGDSDVAQHLSGNTVCTTWLTVCELYRGVFISKQAVSNKAQLDRFLGVVDVLGFSHAACELYGTLYKALNDKGSPTQDMDLLIAALCIANNKILVTRNIKHFKSTPHLRIISW